MERLFVFADFNWLGKGELVGELCYEKLRGSGSYAFKFDENWLKVHAGIKLSEDINNYPGMQYTQPGSDIFGCFSDALPDRWGRTLLKEENRYRPLKKKEQSDLFPHSIISWASMTPPEWVDLGLRRKWKVIISMCLHLSRYPINRD